MADARAAGEAVDRKAEVEEVNTLEAALTEKPSVSPTRTYLIRRVDTVTEEEIEKGIVEEQRRQQWAQKQRAKAKDDWNG